ncbi:MAG TPA: single-stranded DNA-binding protein [Caldisericia bacterium]|jgi:single-strand DNA-binding protein|nr:single-stranded DNA-binding protein [Caldisericia bacterium]HXK51186.1 single-stranded DNA-binding protein [Caldisericia bacterium]
MLNKIMLIGRLATDPDSRFTPNGAQVTDFRLAVSQNRKQGEEWVEDTLFVKITCWGYNAKKVSEGYHKGDLIYVEGRLQIKRYEKNDTVQWYTDIVAQNLQMLSRKQNRSSSEEYSQNHSDDVYPDTQHDDDGLPQEEEIEAYDFSEDLDNVI